MKIDDLAKLMKKNRRDVERILKSSDTIELNLNDENDKNDENDGFRIKLL